MRQYNLRHKVINFVYAGNTQRSASKVFNLSKTKVHAWWLCYKSAGLAVRKSIEKESFIQYATSKRHYACIGYKRQILVEASRFQLYKKTFTYVEASQEKRDTYQEIIKYIPPNVLYQHLVYMDENGIDIAICTDRGWGKKW